MKKTPKVGDLLGKRIGIWWDDDERHYYGKVVKYNKHNNKHYIEYEDGDKEWIDLSKEKLELPVEKNEKEAKPEKKVKKPKQKAAQKPCQVGPALTSFSNGEVVWAKSGKALWPAEVIGNDQLNEAMLNRKKEDQVCILFFGGKKRSWGCVAQGSIFPFASHLEGMRKQKIKASQLKLFEEAIQAAQIHEKLQKEPKAKNVKSPRETDEMQPRKKKKLSQLEKVVSKKSNDSKRSVKHNEGVRHSQRPRKRKFKYADQPEARPPLPYHDEVGHYPSRASERDNAASTSGRSQNQDNKKVGLTPKVYPSLSLESFEVGDVVWARSKGCPYWPALIMDRNALPEAVRGMISTNSICVMYLGPSTSTKRDRDFGWMKAGSVLPFTDYFEDFKTQKITKSHKITNYTAAITEALELLKDNEVVEEEEIVGRPLFLSLHFADSDTKPISLEMHFSERNSAPSIVEGIVLAAASGDRCSSCHCMLKDGKAHQARDWTGLCRSCKRLYEQGSFCKVCEAIYMETEKDMVCCDHCNGWIHARCDSVAGEVIKAEALKPNSTTYYCSICREAFHKQNSKLAAISDGYSLLNNTDASAKDAKLLFAAAFLSDLRKKKKTSGMSVREEARAINQAWEDLGADGRAEYMSRALTVTEVAPSSKKQKSVNNIYARLNESTIPVVCNFKKGLLDFDKMTIFCKSKCCVGKSMHELIFTPQAFEVHAISSSNSRNWGVNIKVDVQDAQSSRVPIGIWINKRANKRLNAQTLLSLNKDGGHEGPWNHIHNVDFQPVKARWAIDHCAVCNGDVDYDHDQFLTCKSCSVTVHQSCYGVLKRPAADDIWLCRVCEKREKGRAQPQCCLCPVEGGALKPTTLPGLWCHIACMQWVPEVTVVDVNRMEPIDRIHYTHKERWEKACSLCKKKAGTIIQCASCFSAFHPLCARMRGCQMELVEDAEGNIDLVAYCPRHSSSLKGATGLLPVGTGSDQDNKKVQDPSSYILNIPLPPLTMSAKSGCARCEPLHHSLGWKREEKGSGRGISSVQGYWIPTLEQLDNRNLKAIKMPSMALANKLKKVKIETNEPKVFVPLLPLPDGCPEQVKVSCGSKVGIFVVRSQTVIHGETEISAPQFEILGGRTAAKKWKASLWLCDEEWRPLCMMQDFLGKFNLDRATLTKFQNNVNDIKMYEEWKEANDTKEVEDTMDLILNQVIGRLCGSASVTLNSHGYSVQMNGSSHDQKIDQGNGKSPENPKTDTVMGIENKLLNGEEIQEVKNISIKIVDEVVRAVLSSKKEVYNNGVTEIKKPLNGKANGITDAKKYAANGEDEIQISNPGRDSNAHENKINQMNGHSILSVESLKSQVEELLIGQNFKIFWKEIDTWLSASIIQYSARHRMHKIKYEDVGKDPEWISIYHERITWSNELQAPPHPRKSTGDMPTLSNEALVNERIGIWWKDDHCFYHGVVLEYDHSNGMSKVLYDDGIEEWLDLSKEKIDRSESQRKERANDVPEFVAISCNGLKAYFLGRNSKIDFGGLVLTPELFEEVSGCANKGKWKANITVLQKDLSTGQAIGEWLIENGLDTWGIKRLQKKKRQLTHKFPNVPGGRNTIRLPKIRYGKQSFVKGIQYQASFTRQAHLIPDYKAWNTDEWLKHSEEVHQCKKEDTADVSGKGEMSPNEGDVNGENGIAEANPCKGTDHDKESREEFDIQDIVKSTVESLIAAVEIRSREETGEQRRQKLSRIDNILGKQVRLREIGKVTCPVLAVNMDLQHITIQKNGNEVNIPFEGEESEIIIWNTLFVSENDVIPDYIVDEDGQNPKPGGDMEACVDWRVSVLWPENSLSYNAIIDDYNVLNDKHRVLYDDSTFEWTDLSKTSLRWLAPPGGYKRPEKGLPMEILVCCNALKGIFYTYDRNIKVLHEGEDSEQQDEQQVTLLKVDEFEEAARKTHPRKQKTRVRLLNHDGTIGKVLSQWLITKGLDLNPWKKKKIVGGDGKHDLDATTSEQEDDEYLKDLHTVPIVEQLHNASINESKVLAFGKSNIHGWGLFAKRNISEGEIVIEYRGDVVRHSVANEREIRYLKQKKDLYLFAVNNSYVVDSTNVGSIARFMNHSCAPSTYTKILEVAGAAPHLAFYARCDIKPGQELTFDYRLAEEDQDNKIECKCGAPNCRETIN